MTFKFCRYTNWIHRFYRPFSYLSYIFPVFSAVLFTFSFLSFGFAQSTAAAKWVGTWSTAPQLVETSNNPPSPGLSNNTLRQIVHVSIGGDSLRMRFSNEFSNSPVTLKSIHMAVSTGSSAIDTTTDKTLYFNGAPEVTIEAGAAVTSDPFEFDLQPLSNVAITIYFGQTSPDVTGHPGSRTTSYLLRDNQVTRDIFSGAVRTDHWYVINTIDVMAPDTSYAVAVLGNSITDGRGSGTNKQNRWPDELARRLQANPATQHVAVLNEGIGGNCVLGACLGPSAISRFERDVINQNGIKWLIILEGINDIGNSSGSGVGNRLIDAYQQMIYSAHANGFFVYGATLLPMGHSFYYSVAHETERQIVNEWIRNSGEFDAVIDLDMALRNPADTLSLRPEADTGDHLHPNETGHRLMAEAVDLNLFSGSDSVDFTDKIRMIYFEPECATVGENWDILSDAQASNKTYVTVKSGIQSINAAPSGSESTILIPFSVDSAGNYSVFARLNCPTYDDDSYWVKMDDGTYKMYNGLATGGWEWKKFDDYSLSEGGHTLTIAYREDGAKLDKICISNASYIPMGMGEEAENICDPVGVKNSKRAPVGYALEQNYPNPFNPITFITYSIPEKSFISLKLWNLLGEEVKTLYEGVRQPGDYTESFNAEGLPSGIYFYRLKTENFSETKQFILLK
ncbi:T9SS type A sorting domain-containing protein [candidate division KSB1 bacterium]|nr:T9SS type A sorting domain-containing protein [candidate division KSB1 bacterium]